jgi:2-polyprenyl-6-methoxyphenol hydroxylase-like FAD-dependent oxidoreductase
VNSPRDAQAMELEKRAATGRVEGAGQDAGRWPYDEAAPALAPTPHPQAARLAAEVRTATIDDLLRWVEQAQLQAERPLQLELAVAQTTVDRARTHHDEEQLVLQGLRRQLAEAGPWWRPGNRERRSALKDRIAERRQLLTRLAERFRQAEEQVRELRPASQAALETWAADQRRVLDRAVAAAQELQRRHSGVDGPLLDDRGLREQPPAAGPALQAFMPRAGPNEASPTRSEPAQDAQDRVDAAAQVTTPEPARASVNLALRHRPPRAGLHENLSIAIVGGSITGPVLCLLLRQAGFNDVRIYEATPSAVPQAGGVIGLDHTSLGVLDTIGVPQDEIVPFPSERVISVKVADRREVGRVETLYPGRNTTWTLAHHALTQRLPADSLRSSARLTGLEAGDDGRAVLQFAGGERATADLVAFADGRKSTGRKLLDPERPLHYAGYVAHRGQLDDCPPELRDTWRYEPGGTQFTVFPIRQLGEEGIGTDWTFYLNATAEQFRMHFGADPTNRTFVLPQHVSAEARSHVDAMATKLLTPEPAELVHRTTRQMAVPILDIAPPTRMVYPVGSGHAVLLGDALAPVRPHTARGANNGIDQAAALATALASYRNDGVDLDVTLSAWQERSLPLVNEALERGPELGQALGLGL